MASRERGETGGTRPARCSRTARDVEQIEAEGGLRLRFAVELAGWRGYGVTSSLAKAFALKDTTIGVELIDVPRSKIQKSLLEPERAGAIIRASASVNDKHGKDKPQRRIWPCVRVIHKG